LRSPREKGPRVWLDLDQKELAGRAVLEQMRLAPA
jgi:hypothetical protein